MAAISITITAEINQYPKADMENFVGPMNNYL